MARRDKSNGGTAVEERGEQQSAESRASKSESRGTAVAPATTSGVPFWGPTLTAAPFTLLRRVNEDFNQLFDALLRGGTDPGTGGRAGRGALTTPGQGFAALAAWTPQIEIERRKDALVIRADLAGVNPDDVDVTVENGVLTISGERRQERREEREGVVHTELSYGSFMRSIPLPDGADENRLSATMRNGSLEITVPIAARERGRRVKVQHS